MTDADRDNAWLDVRMPGWVGWYVGGEPPYATIRIYLPPDPLD